MESALISPAAASIAGIPTIIFSILIPVAGIAIFIYIMVRRITPLVKAAPDERTCCIGQRIGLTLKIWQLFDRIDLARLEALMAGGDYIETWKFIEQNIFSIK